MLFLVYSEITLGNSGASESYGANEPLAIGIKVGNKQCSLQFVGMSVLKIPKNSCLLLSSNIKCMVWIKNWLKTTRCAVNLNIRIVTLPNVPFLLNLFFRVRCQVRAIHIVFWKSENVKLGAKEWFVNSLHNLNI